MSAALIAYNSIADVNAIGYNSYQQGLTLPSVLPLVPVLSSLREPH
jgi:hypothetical protein